MDEHKTAKQTVLVVDDYDEVRELTRKALESLGYSVLEASDGQAAVEVARRELPQLILMDLSMPSLDGFAAMQRIQKQAGLLSVPIVIMSGHTSSDVRADAIAAGCREYITKPLDFDELKRLLEEILPRAAHLSREEDI